MSAISGRVLLIPKGNYDSTATYTMLDMVVYNGSSYICKQECTGVVPTNTTYWMLNASGSAVAYINDIGDVVITNVSNGQVLMYDSTSGKWKNQTPTTTLVGLSDTQISSATDGQVLKFNSTSQKWVNGEDKGGILPHLIVISETGSTVTATKGQTVITATETSTGHFECDLPEFGTWTIDAILSGDDAQVSLVVDTVKVYTVDDSHFHATVTVKYPDGATCRLQSADETLYATGSPYTFTVHHAETYTITVTYNQRIYTYTVTFTTEGQSFSKTLPTPSDVDANDINWWLFFGGVSGTFSSLEEILANSTALSTLMASTDAVDYLVRCKDWIVKEALVPTMTSDTTPSGEVFASGNQGTSYLPYKAFDGDDTTRWSVTGANISGAYIGYKFTTPKKVNKIYTYVDSSMTRLSSCEFKVQGSNDGSTWTDIDTITWVAQTGEQSFSIQNDNEYLYYRLYCNSSNGMMADSQGTTHYVLFYTLQFYTSDKITDNQSAMSYIGLNNYCANTLLADSDWLDGICNSEYFESVLNVKVPTMTSYNTPIGEVIGTISTTGSYPSYYAFDGNVSSFTMGNNNTAGSIGYKFTSAKKVKLVSITNRSGANYYINKFKVQASNNTTFIDISSQFTNQSGLGLTTKFPINNDNTYLSYKIAWDNTVESPQLAELQFYGREDV